MITIAAFIRYEYKVWNKTLEKHGVTEAFLNAWNTEDQLEENLEMKDNLTHEIRQSNLLVT